MDIFRYFYLNRRKDLFSNISEFYNGDTACCLSELIKNELAFRTYDNWYIQRRFAAESEMRAQFMQKGGTPVLEHPYYFTLGNCDDWFYRKKHSFGSLSFGLSEFDKNTVSFTYGDSVPNFMSEYADGKEYRRKVYTYEEICGLIEKYGYPNDWNAYGEHGPENYIEVQVWSDDLIGQYRYEALLKRGTEGVHSVADRIMRANRFRFPNAEKQLGLAKGLDECKKNPLWDWFLSTVRETDNKLFKDDAVHGAEHAKKCAVLAFILSNKTGACERRIKNTVYAALYHDIGRTCRAYGKSHGQCGAERIRTLVPPSKDWNTDIVCRAIAMHDGPQSADDGAVLTAVREADCLDYMRLGFGIYDATRLATAEGRELLRFALELNIASYMFPSFIRYFSE